MAEAMGEPIPPKPLKVKMKEAMKVVRSASGLDRPRPSHHPAEAMLMRDITVFVCFSCQVASRWSELSDTERLAYEAKALADKQRHKREVGR